MTDARLIDVYHRLASLGMSLFFSACNGCGTTDDKSDAGTSSDSDTTTDTTTDTETDTSSDGGTGAIPCGDDFQLNWEPLPQGIDCGPGCRQLTFIPINSVVGWSSSGTIFAASGDSMGAAVIVDILDEKTTFIDPETYMEGNPYLGFPTTDGTEAFYSMTSHVGSSWIRAMVRIDTIQGTCSQFINENDPDTAAVAYSNMSALDKRVCYLKTAPDISSKKSVNCVTSPFTTPIAVADDFSVRFYTGLGDDFLIWSQGPMSTSGDIWAHRFSTGETWNVTDHPAEQYFPRIDGSRVVWTDNRNGGAQYWDHADIYMRDLETGVTTRVTDGDWIQMHPDISGDRVVFEDYRASDDPNNPADFAGVDIWMVDLSNGEEQKLTSFPGGETLPQIVGDKLYYYRKVPGETYFAVFEQDLNLLEPQPADAGASYR